MGQKITLSTAFSGIGAPEQACHGLAQYLAEKHAVDPRKFRLYCASGVEWNAFSRAELSRHAHAPRHLFIDIAEFIHDSIRRGVQDAAAQGKWTVDSLAETLNKPGAIVPWGTCSVCNAQCQMTTSTIHCAGTPCVDFSSMPGASHMGALGPASVTLFVWIGLRLLLQEPVIIHENVPSFPVSLLERFLGHLYIVMSVVISLTKLGWPQRRDRRISVLLHKSKVTAKVMWNTNLVALAYRKCTLDFHAFMLATDSEIQEERKWALARGSKQSAAPRVGCLEATKNDADVVNSSSVQVLNKTELDNLREYRRKWPRCAYLLAQDVRRGFAMKSTETTLPTQIKNQQLVFVDKADRWLTPRELLGLQGFPVYAEQKQWNITCPFDRANPMRTRDAMIEQSGNSMPVLMISLPIMFALGLTDLCRERIPVAAAPHSLRRQLRATYTDDTADGDESTDEAAGPSAPKMRRLLH